MKTLFFSNEELKSMVKEFYPNKNASLGYCEEMEVDTVEFYNEEGTEVLDVVLFDDLMLRIGERHNMNIKSFEVLELEPLGVGFLFSF